MLTADSVTDEQIRELRDSILAEDIRAIQGAEFRFCQLALGTGTSIEVLMGVSSSARKAARARCAEILNARAARPPDCSPPRAVLDNNPTNHTISHGTP